MTSDFFATADRMQRPTRLAASAAAVLAALSGVGLVALSGWFLIGAAVAGLGGVVAVQAFNYLLPSASMRALAIIRTLSRYGERLLGHRAALFTLADVRPRLFARVARSDIDSFSGRAGGTIAAHLGSDVEALEDMAIRRVAITGAAAGAATGIAAAALAGIGPALVLAVGLVLSVLTTRALAAPLLRAPHARHGQAIHGLKALYAEYAGASVELALYGETDRISTILEMQAREADKARLAVVRAETLLQGLQLALASLTVAAMLAVTKTTAPLQALAVLAGAGAFEAIGSLGASLLQRSRAEAALGRLGEIDNLPQRASVQALPEGAAPTLTLFHDGRSVTAQPGTRLRLSGASGSGKTRLIEAMVGLRHAVDQPILIGGIPASDLDIDQLRQIFAISPQDSPLLAGTVRDNLRLARPGLDDDMLWSALEVACLAETLAEMPEGLDTWLGADGARLSGGQRKRLSLARAILAGKPWLVLDEPSEGLDLATEQQLASRLDRWLRETGTGLVLVNHRTGLNELANIVLAI